jgi:hypothetical protein
MSLKVGIVILVAVVALFVAALVAGGAQDGNGSAERDRNGVLDRLTEAAGDPAGVKPSDVAADCFSDDDPARLTFVGGCTLTVSNDTGIKVLRLVTDTPVRIVAPAPRGDTEVEATADPGDEESVAVGDGETRIGLGCEAGLGVPCNARIVLILGGGSAGAALVEQSQELDVDVSGVGGVEEPPGRGISYLVLVDGILLYTVVLMGVALLIPDRVHARVQGAVTLIASIILIIVAIVLAIIAFIELLVMVTLLAATPSGRSPTWPCGGSSPAATRPCCWA